MRNQNLLYLGFIIPLIFWGTIILCGLMTPDYNHLINLVSELGAIGTRTQYFFTTGLIISSFLSVFFIIGLYRTAKSSKLKTIPIIIILTFSISVLGAGIFPLPNRMHGILGSPSIFLPLSPLFALILWKTNRIQNIKSASLIVLIIMLLGFSTQITLMNDFFGLKQRFFHIGWTLWFIYLSKSFLKLNKIN